MEGEYKADYRAIHAKADMQSGRRAYSDAYNHIIVKMAGSEHGIDVLSAVRLVADLERAIKNASLSDGDYLNMCGS